MGTRIDPKYKVTEDEHEYHKVAYLGRIYSSVG